MIPRSPEPERGLVLAVLAQGREPEDELAEVEELARTAGVEPVGRVVQHRPRPARRTYVGKGKLEELKERYAAVDLRHAQHLAEEEPVDVDVVRLECEHAAKSFEREPDGVDPEPGPGRVGCAPLEDDTRDEVAEAAELERVVGRLEADRELCFVHDRRRSEHGGQRVLRRAELLSGEEQERDVIGEVDACCGPEGELEHHCEPALHVTGAEAHDRSVLDPAGQVLLGRDGIHVAREEDKRIPASLREDQRLPVVEGRGEEAQGGDVAVQLCLTARFGRDVDEVEGAFRQWHDSRR